MQSQAGTRHAKLSDNACAQASAKSLKCAPAGIRLPVMAAAGAHKRRATGIEENYTDKSKCAPFFNAYKECKKADYEAARAARIKAHSG